MLARHLDPRRHRAWIIGSEATGHALPGSDVDLALEGPTPIDLGALARLRDELERLPSLRSFDLVDLRRVTERFANEALQVTVPLALDPKGGAGGQG